MSASQRRYARLKTRELATLAFPSGEKFTCEIRDYCQKGLNILPTNPDAAATFIAKLPPNTLGEVEFPVGKDAGPSYKIKGKLIFRSPTDIGMYIEDMPRDALRALTHSRTKLPQRDEIQDSLLPEESQAILRDSVNLFRVFLSDAWQELQTFVKKRVNERDASPLPLSEHSRFLNGLTELMLDIDSISKHHFEMLVDRMERIGEIKKDEAPKNMDELSIVDEGSFDDWLNITNVYNRIEADIRSSMFEFAQRFSRLTPIQIAAHNDPFGPQAVCLTFQESLHGLNFSNEMRAILYRQFGDSLKAGYAKLYEDLNQLLLALKPIPPASGKQTYEHGVNADTGVHFGGTGGGNLNIKSSDQMLRLAEIAERVFSLYPPLPAAGGGFPMGGVPPGAAVMPPGLAAGAAAPLSGAMPPGAVIPPVGGVVAAPGGIFAGYGNVPGIITPGYVGGYPGVVFQPGALNAIPIAVLATQSGENKPLENAGPQSYVAPLRFALDNFVARDNALPQEPRVSELPPEMPAKVQDLLKQSTAETPANPKASLTDNYSKLLSEPKLASELPEPLREELGSLAQVMSKAISEYEEDSDIRNLLKKIEKPIYDLALSSNTPPRLDTHPLGRMINLIDRLAIVTDDRGRFVDLEFRDLVNSVVDKGLSKGPHDLAQIENSCVAIEKLLNHPLRVRKQRISGYQEICEARGRIRNSHQSVADDLNARHIGRSIPKIVDTFLEQGWQHLIVLARLRGNDKEQEELWQTLNDLVTANRATTAKATRLLNRIESRLQEVNTDEKQVGQLMKNLATFLNAPEKEEQVLITGGWFKSYDSVNDPPTRATEALATKLRTGDWWDIEQEGRSLPMQLIWQSSPAARVCFTNRSAMRKLELTLSELASLYGGNKAKPGENRDTPLLERAEYWAIDSIYQGLVRQAGQDQVTKLPNRKSLLQIATTLAKPGRESSYCIVRFDPFELIFSTCGRQAGERLSQELAGKIAEKLGKNDHLAYLGEGAFAVFMPNISAEAARVFANSLTRVFHDYRFKSEEQSFTIHSFYGISGFRPEAISADDALSNSVTAANIAKSMGPNSIEVYSDINATAPESESLDKWGDKIDAMFEANRLYLRCQKVTPIQDEGSVPYYEVLLGVLDDNGKQVNPQPFVLAVEHWNRAHELDLWVFGEVAQWIRKHPEAFDKIGGFSVNLSAQSLSNGQLLSTLHKELSVGDLPCDKIVFEITETATLQSHAVAQDFIRQIRRYGCRFSLDDFGSGNASFGYLRNLRTDSLKIDGTYVKDMADDNELQAMVRSMNDIGHALGMKTVAEYVASPALLSIARSIGIDYAQGFGVEMPMHIDSLLRSN